MTSALKVRCQKRCTNVFPSHTSKWNKVKRDVPGYGMGGV